MYISEEDQRSRAREIKTHETLGKIISTYRKLRLNTDVSRFIEESSLELALFDAMETGVYMIDYELGTYAFVNRALTKMFGLSHKDLLNAPISKISEFIHPDDLPVLMNVIEKTSGIVKKLSRQEREQIIFRAFYRIKKPGGGFCWSLQTNKIINDRISGGQIDFGTLICLPDHHIVDMVSGHLRTNSREFEIHEHAAGNNPISQLSAREKEVLVLVSKGLSTREIAEKFSLSSETIKIHRKKILKKLNVGSSIQAVRMLQKYGKSYT